MQTFDLAKRERQFSHCLAGLLDGLMRWRDVVDYMPLTCRQYRIRSVREPGGVPTPAREIVAQILDQYNMTIADIQSPKRIYTFTRPRHHLCYRLLAETKLSRSQVGKIINRDRQTVRHGATIHAARHGLVFEGRRWHLNNGGHPSAVSS